MFNRFRLTADQRELRNVFLNIVAGTVIIGLVQGLAFKAVDKIVG